MRCQWGQAVTNVSNAEARKPWWHGGIGIQKVFSRQESFCAQPLKLQSEVSGPSGKFPDSLDNFLLVRKVYNLMGRRLKGNWISFGRSAGLGGGGMA